MTSSMARWLFMGLLSTEIANRKTRAIVHVIVFVVLTFWVLPPAQKKPGARVEFTRNTTAADPIVFLETTHGSKKSLGTWDCTPVYE